jgi:hypothetical protein
MTPCAVFRETGGVIYSRQRIRQITSCSERVNEQHDNTSEN